LEPNTTAAFDSYVQATETQIAAKGRHEAFLWIENLPEGWRASTDAQLRAGQVVIERLDTLNLRNGGERGKPIAVPGGLIHHWIGTVFIPGATLAQTLALEEDYDHHQDYFRPDVMRSKILRHDGNDFLIELRLYKKKIITAVLDTEHEVNYTLVDATHASSRSRTTRIQEVDNAGETRERLEPVGHDQSFLWRMNTYWRFEENDGGTYVECQSVSLDPRHSRRPGLAGRSFRDERTARISYFHARHHSQRGAQTNQFLNVAVAVLFWIAVNVQDPVVFVPIVTEQTASLAVVAVPPHAVKVDKDPAVAVRVTKVPLAYRAVQVPASVNDVVDVAAVCVQFI
jgi:hypothetical protein